MKLELVQSLTPALEPVHISRLRLMSLSAAHYAAGHDGVETYAMERGTAVHSLVLGGGQRVVSMAEGKQRRGKEYDAFVADNPDAQILTYKEGRKALAMAESVKRCRDAMNVLEGNRETTLNWKNGERGCEGTPDVHNPGRYITELKTCPSAHPERFSWHARKLGYHAQTSWYQDGVTLAGFPVPPQAFIVAVESTWPHPTTVLRLKERASEQGRRMCRLWWERLLACEDANEWPPYVQSVVDLDVPDDEMPLEFTDGEMAEAGPAAF